MQSEMKLSHIPQYPELSVKKLWEHAKESKEVLKYFPDDLDTQLPDKQYLHSVLLAKFSKGVKQLVTEARSTRALVDEADKEDFFEIDPEIKALVKQMLLIGSRLQNDLITIATNGRAVAMLNKKVKLMRVRGDNKKYDTNFRAL